MKIFCQLALIALTLLWVTAYSLKVGVGIYDMTGPVTEVNFMGYALPSQRGSGIHLRLWARSFAFEDNDRRVAFVSVDGGMGSDLVKMKVLEQLETRLGKGVYTQVIYPLTNPLIYL
jgi:neutral ceramidase